MKRLSRPSPAPDERSVQDAKATSVPFTYPVGKVISVQIFIKDSGVGLRTQKREFKRVNSP